MPSTSSKLIVSGAYAANVVATNTVWIPPVPEFKLERVEIHCDSDQSNATACVTIPAVVVRFFVWLLVVTDVAWADDSTRVIGCVFRDRVLSLSSLVVEALVCLVKVVLLKMSARVPFGLWVVITVSVLV